MTKEEYEQFVESKQSTPRLCSVLGVAGEAGEVVDYIKKCEFHGHKLDIDKLGKELGDLLWYLTDVAHRYAGTSLEGIMALNVKKLNARYAAAFTPEESQKR